jgi:imidazolonepropionase-like amidohydrolase
MRLTLAFFFTLIIGFCTAQEVVDSKDREIVFRSVNVIPMDKEEVIPNQVVVIKNGKIIRMGDPQKTTYSQGALVIEGNGKYLLPGLAEMHAHVPPVDDFDPMKEVLLLFAANGVTTIRGMLGHPFHLQLRSMIQSGEAIGPRLITSGPSLNGNSVKTPHQADSMVRKQKIEGYDFLKLHPGIKLENFNAIVKTARQVNIPFAGHVSFDVGVWRAIEAGYATIDHLDGFIEGLLPPDLKTTEQQNGAFAMFIADKAETDRIPKLMQALREKNVWVVPTQALAERWFAPIETESLSKEPEMVYMAPATLNAWKNSKNNLRSNANYNPDAIKRFIDLRRKLINACNKNGVGLLLGSDAPQVFDVPGFSIHHELRYMVDAGLSPYEALKTGTVNVGKFLGKPDLGTIKQGSVADLVLLNANPLTDINQAKNIEGVMLNGKWLSKKWIDQTLLAIQKKHNP